MGALPTANAPPGCSAAARSMHTAARVTPRSLACRTVSGSAMKHTASPPSLDRAALLIPALAMLVSVTMERPSRRAATAASAPPSVKRRLPA